MPSRRQSKPSWPRPNERASVSAGRRGCLDGCVAKIVGLRRSGRPHLARREAGLPFAVRGNMAATATLNDGGIEFSTLPDQRPAAAASFLARPAIQSRGGFVNLVKEFLCPSFKQLVSS